MTFKEIRELVNNSANLTLTENEFTGMLNEVFNTFCSDTNLYKNNKVIDISDSTINYGGKILKIYTIKNTEGNIYNYTMVREGNSNVLISIFEEPDMTPITTGKFYIYYSYIPTLNISYTISAETIPPSYPPFIFPDEYLKGIISALLAQAYLRKSEVYMKNEDVEMHNIFSEKATYYNNIYSEVRKKCIKNTENMISTLPDVKQHDLGDF